MLHTWNCYSKNPFQNDNPAKFLPRGKKKMDGTFSPEKKKLFSLCIYCWNRYFWLATCVSNGMKRRKIYLRQYRNFRFEKVLVKDSVAISLYRLGHLMPLFFSSNFSPFAMLVPGKITETAPCHLFLIKESAQCFPWRKKKEF